MARDIEEIYLDNPTTTIPNDALMYLGLPPYGSDNDSAVKSQDIFPISATDNSLVLFNGTSGKKIKELAPGASSQVLTCDDNGEPLYQYVNPVFIDSANEITVGSQGEGTDYGRYRVLTGTGVITVNLPDDAHDPIPAGVEWEFFLQSAATTVEFQAAIGSSLTIESLDGNTTLDQQYGWVKLKKIASDTFNLISIPALIPDVSYFVSRWDTSEPGVSAGDQVQLPLDSGGTYNFTVYWGDGTSDVITAWNQAETLHTYASSGNKTIKISGTCIGWVFNNGGDKLKIKDISEWGSLRLGNATNYFTGCSNLRISATDNLNLTGTLNMTSAFQNCSLITTIPSINTWNFTAVTNASSMLAGCSSFNQQLFLDLSACLSLNSFLKGCSAFNSDVSLTTVVNTSLASFLEGCSIFNSDLSFSSTASVINCARTFYNCVSYNKPINFDLTNCNTLSNFLALCSSFNSSVTLTNTGSVTAWDSVFLNCSAFNQSVSFTTTAATGMSSMFYNCVNFNGTVTFSDSSNVTDMSYMFGQCGSFNQPLSFSTASVVTMENMFSFALSFDQDVGGFDITSLLVGVNMFNGVTLSNANYNALLVGWSAQTTPQNSVVFNAGNSHYSGAGVAARAILTGTYGWAITDGGTP